jgi:hypothetical protein
MTPAYQFWPVTGSEIEIDRSHSLNSRLQNAQKNGE